MAAYIHLQVLVWRCAAHTGQAWSGACHRALRGMSSGGGALKRILLPPRACASVDWLLCSVVIPGGRSARERRPVGSGAPDSFRARCPAPHLPWRPSPGARLDQTSGDAQLGRAVAWIRLVAVSTASWRRCIARTWRANGRLAYTPRCIMSLNNPQRAHAHAQRKGLCTECPRAYRPDRDGPMPEHDFGGIV